MGYSIKNYWVGLDIIDQGKVKGKILQFIYLTYPWTNFYKILSTMMALGLATKKKLKPADLENVGQSHHLPKSYLCYYMTNFNQTSPK